MDRKQLGRLGLSLAIAYYTKQGYTVSLPINDTQWYDLVIERDGVFESVQCKATATDKGTIDLRCTGGTDGGTYDHTLNHSINRLFCVDGQCHLYDIPVEEIRKYKSQLNTMTLRTEKSSNGQGFQTYLYLVSL